MLPPSPALLKRRMCHLAILLGFRWCFQKVFRSRCVYSVHLRLCFLSVLPWGMWPPPRPGPSATAGQHRLGRPRARVARDPRGATWVGTYGHGIYRLPVGATAWESIRHDSTETSISWDFVQALAFGARGQIWYGTLGNGWGLSTDGGATWKNWAFKQLGPEWQYVTPSGIVVRGDTTVIGTADGLQLTSTTAPPGPLSATPSVPGPGVPPIPRFRFFPASTCDG